MSISPGLTVAEIRAFVDVYHLQPHGQKSVWLAAQGVSYARSAEHKGAELARLQARVDEREQNNESLEKANEALGKASGLLHAMREQEPDAAATTSDPGDSSPPRT